MLLGLRGGDAPRLRLPLMFNDSFGDDAADCSINGRWSSALNARRLTLTAYIFPVCATSPCQGKVESRHKILHLAPRVDFLGADGCLCHLTGRTSPITIFHHLGALKRQKHAVVDIAVQEADH